MVICLSVACLAGCVPTAKKKIADKIAQDEQVDGVEDAGNNIGNDVGDNTQPTKEPDAEIKFPPKYENNPDAKLVKLTIVAPEGEIAILKTLCTSYDDLHPEYAMEFTFEVCEDGDVYSVLSSEESYKGDIIYFNNRDLVDFVDNGYLMDLGPEIKERAEATLAEGAVASAKYGDNLYGIPYAADVWYLYYNKNMFTEEEVADLDVMMKKDLYGCDYNLSISLNNAWYLGGFFIGGGCTLFGPNGDDKTQCDWASDRGVAIVNYLNCLASNDKFYVDKASSYDAVIGMLAEGKCAAYCSGTWDALKIKEALGDNYAAVKLPHFTYEYNGEKVTKEITPFGDYKSIGVIRDTEYPAEAAIIAEYLCSEYCQEVRLKARSMPPTNVALMENVEKYGDPAVSAGVDQMNNVFPRPRIDQLDKFWVPVANLGDNILRQSENVTSGDENTKKYLEGMVEQILE